MSMTLRNSGILRALNTLTNISSELALSNTRLATSRRITAAGDDPAGLIAATLLEADIAQIDAIAKNGERINSIIDTADGAMAQISSLLNDIESNVLAASGSAVTAEERAAYQAEIDTAIDAIDSLVNQTSFNGIRLLDGGLGYSVTGADTAKIDDVRISSANTASGNASLSVSVTGAAQKAAVSYSGGALAGDVTLVITGSNGTEQIELAAGATQNDIEDAVNAVSDATGVEANINAGTLYFKSAEYGSSQTVSVSVTEGTFALDGGISSDTGADATVTVNGQAADTDGLRVYFRSGDTSAQFTLRESFGNVAGGSTSFTVSGDGANWSLDPNPANAIHFGLSSLGSAFLGNDSVGMLNSLKSGGDNDLSSGNYQTAANIVSAATSQVVTDRARLGAVQTYTVNASLNAYAAAKTAMSNSYSSIMDLDYAQEMANNSRLQLLMQMGTSILSTMNQNYSSILSLLQR